MLRVGGRFFTLVGSLFLSLSAAQAQPVELLVRIREGETTLHEALDGARMVPGVSAGLFEDVVGVRPAFPERTATLARADWTADVFILALADSAALAPQLARWAAEPGVVYAQPNYRATLDALDGLDDEPYADSVSFLRVTRTDEAWATTQGDRGVRIGFVDTGLYFEHPDLREQVWTNPGEVAGNGLDDDGNGYADDVHGYDFVDRPGTVETGEFYQRDPDPSEDGLRDHGTTVSGVAVGALDGQGMAGGCPGCSLLPLRAFGRDGDAETDDIAAALVYAADLGVEVVNMSFGMAQDSPLLHEAIRYAYDRGVVLVASGGNVGGDSPHYPSDYPEVIGVVWLREDGLDVPGLSTSQHGPGIALGAPASAVFTTLKPREGDTRPPEQQLYGRRSGSSYAAPQVAAAAGLLRSLRPELTPTSIRGVLTATARDIREPGWDHTTGAGLLDVANALGLPYPTNASLLAPTQDGGAPGGPVAVVGSAMAPLFASWRLEYTTFDDDNPQEPLGEWQSIVGPVQTQVREDTLTVWNTSSLADGVYLLRLAVELTNGQTLEARHRFHVDRTPPEVEGEFVGPAYFDGGSGVLVEVTTDDAALAEMMVLQGGVPLGAPVRSVEWGRRHGLFWPNEDGRTGAFTVAVRATNRAGVPSSLEDQTVTLDPLPLNTALFAEQVLDVPSGYLMETATDYDRDGLREIVFNRLVDGEPSDTLMIYEGGGGTFRPVVVLDSTRFIPRDPGDTDGDGKGELLLQFGTFTFLIEAARTAAECASSPSEGCYPNDHEIIFSDVTLPGQTRRPFWGARLLDLDNDGRGEILGHDLRIGADSSTAGATDWRLFEWNGGSYTEAFASLENPTENSHPDDRFNSFSDPRALVGNFDGDGLREFVAGDNDGDFIVYEAAGDNRAIPVWSFETDRFLASSRMTAGDFDGDGIEEFWGFTTPNTARDVEAPNGIAYYFDSASGNRFDLEARLAFQGLSTRYGALGADDFDGDGVEELVVVHPPDLWVFRASDWRPIFHAGAVRGATGPTGLRSIRVVTDDFDGDGRPEIVVSGADGRMRRFTYEASQSGLAPPNWIVARAIDAAAVRLGWYAPGADSVTVFAALPGQSFNPIATTAADSLDLAATQTREYALRAWYDGSPSALSPARTVRPHAPAVVEEVTYPSAGYVRLRFTEPLAPDVVTEQFRLDDGRVPVALLLQEGSQAVTLRFEPPPQGTATLLWVGVRDAEGTPTGQTVASLQFPDMAAEGALHLLSWEVLDRERVRLVFNRPLDGETASATSSYRLEPGGEVVAVTFNPAQPTEVVLTVSGRALGATGLRATVVVTGVRGADGSTLAPEGNVATLSDFAEDMSDVYVFPNPYRAGRGEGRVVIAGLPREATIRILSPGGELVRVIEETDGDGGASWDLADASGAPVPSGIYLVWVEAEGLEPVIVKAALLR